MTGKSSGTNKYLLTCITGGRNIIFVPGLGEKIFSTVPEDEAVVYIDALLRTYRRLGRTGERIAQTLARVGREHFAAETRTEVARIRAGAAN